MRDFLIIDLEDICGKIYHILMNKYPGKSWIILPEINIAKGIVNIFIATKLEEKMIFYNHFVEILKPWDLESKDLIFNYFNQHLLEKNIG
jgi:hypothetical protein